MKIVLYRFSYRKNDIVKNLNNSEIYTCTLRFPTNILDPIVRIQLDTPTTTIKNWSYAYIEEFGARYYFVENVVAFTNNIYDLYLHVDVLFTYIGKTNAIFRNETVFLNRAENSSLYDVNYFDTRCWFRPFNDITYSALTNLVSNDFGIDSIGFKDVYDMDNIDYDLTVAISVTTRNNPKPLQLVEDPRCAYCKDIYNINTADLLGNKTYILSRNKATLVLNELITDDQKASYIRGIRVLPFCLRPSAVSTDNNTGTISYGNNMSFSIGATATIYTWSNQTEYRFGSYDLTNFKPTSFTDYNGYRKVELYVPFYGWLELDNSLIRQYKYVDVTYVMNWDTLESNVHVYFRLGDNFATSDKLLYKDEKVVLGMDVAVNTSNDYENNQKRNSIAMQTSIGAVSSVLAIGAGLALSETGLGVPMMIGGVASLGSTVGNAFAQSKQIYDYGTKTVLQNADDNYIYDVCILRITKPITFGYTSSWVSENGRPSYKNVVLKNCLDYCEFGKVNFSLENTKEEEELVTLLMEGVHFPHTIW